MMSFIELVEEVAKHSGQPKKTVAKALRGFIAVTRKTLEDGEAVRLYGFGVFRPVYLKPKKVFGRMSVGRCKVRFKESRRASHG